MKGKGILKLVFFSFIILSVFFLLFNLLSTESKAQPNAGYEGTVQLEDDGGVQCSGIPYNCPKS